MADVDWGTVPTMLSLPAALWAAYTSHHARRDNARSSREEQARQIAVSPVRVRGEPGASTVRLQASVLNTSSAPIFDVWVAINSPFAVGPLDEFAGELSAAGRYEVDREVAARPDPHPVDGDSRLKVSVSFQDANGWNWQKWANGEFMPPVDLRPRSGRAAALRRLVPGRLRHRWLRRKNRPPVRGRRL